jgi:galactosylceramidase
LQLADDGRCSLVVRGKKEKKALVGDAEQQALLGAQRDDSEGGEKVLATVQLPAIGPQQWHTLKLRFEGATITGLVDEKPVLQVVDALYAQGMAGLMAQGDQKRLSTPFFDNLLLTGVRAPVPATSLAAPGHLPLYR